MGGHGTLVRRDPQLVGEVFQSRAGLGVVGLPVGLGQLSTHPPLLGLRQVVENIVLLVDGAPLHENVLAKHSPHGRSQRFGLVDDHQQPVLVVELVRFCGQPVAKQP